jgi:hypothetical protein
VQFRHAGVDQHTAIGMVDDVHIDGHPLILGQQVGNADWRDSDFFFHGSYFTKCSTDSAAHARDSPRMGDALLCAGLMG